MKAHIFALAVINAFAFVAFTALMFVTGGYLEAHDGKSAPESLLILIFWSLANAWASWKLFGLEADNG